jgi:Ca2+-binding EF-hand superfamily protein
MNVRLTLLAALQPVLAAWIAAGPSPGASPAQEPEKGRPCDVLLLAKPRPVLIRFDVHLDGRPLDAAWNGFVDHLFRRADGDGDGQLSRAEAELLPPPSALAGGDPLSRFSAVAPGRGRASSDIPTRAALAEYLRRNGVSPFRVCGRTGASGRNSLTIGENTPSSGEMSRALLKLLDTDRDGKLSRGEAAAAARVFRKWDINEDEYITAEELLPEFTPLTFDVGGQRGAEPTGNGDTDAFAAVLASEVTEPRALARLLLDRYGIKKGQTRLPRRGFRLETADFVALDRDLNGALDAQELGRFAAREPDLRLVIRMGERPANAPAAELTGGAARESVRSLRPSADSLVLLVGGSRLVIRTGAARDRSEYRSVVRQLALDQFRRCDRDGDGFLDRRETQEGLFDESTFRVMDRDRDGRLSEKELTAYLAAVEGLHARLTAASLSLDGSEGDRGPFALFDGDGDGRLSPREVQQMARLVDELDRDGDGALASSEIPPNYILELQPGVGDAADNPLAALEMPDATFKRRPPGPGPVWFARMDRNRDGNVSRHEFLGTVETFRALDADGDGLIDLGEAQRFEERSGRSRPAKR